MDNHINILLSTTISFILEKLNVSRIYVNTISMSLASILVNMNYPAMDSFGDYIVYGKCTVLFTLIGYCCYYYYYYSTKKEKQVSYIDLGSCFPSTTISYLRNHTNFNQQSYNQICPYNGDSYFSPDKNIEFVDTLLNVSGFLSTIVSIKEEALGQTVIKKPIYSTRLYIYPTSDIPNCRLYHNKISKQYKKDLLLQTDIHLKYYKLIGTNICAHYTIFDGKKNQLIENRELFLSTFIHPKKDQIIEYIDTIINKPQTFHKYGSVGYMNMILHGPPGTGKSTFISRIAKSFGMDIISIDLGSIKSVSEVYQLIHTPRVYIAVDNPYIIVLEEFDNVVFKLEKKKNKKIHYMVNNVKVEHDDDTNDDAFRLEDLLEILQGSVIREKQIVIATTNHLDKIYDICPSLFRPGRLTPIVFDYLKRDDVNKLLDVYFDTPEIETLYVDFDPELPSSLIIETCLSCKISGKLEPIYDLLRKREHKIKN